MSSYDVIQPQQRTVAEVIEVVMSMDGHDIYLAPNQPELVRVSAPLYTGALSQQGYSSVGQVTATHNGITVFAEAVQMSPAQRARYATDAPNAYLGNTEYGVAVYYDGYHFTDEQREDYRTDSDDPKRRAVFIPQDTLDREILSDVFVSMLNPPQKSLRDGLSNGELEVSLKRQRLLEEHYATTDV